MTNRRAKLFRLESIQPRNDRCFYAPLPEEAPAGDDLNDVRRSSTRLFENGVELGPAHSVIDEIAEKGNGRYSHWQRWVYFSSSDGSDPRTNGYEYYVLCAPTLGSFGRRLEDLARSDLEDMDGSERYAVAEELFKFLVPNDRLAESGRSFFLEDEFLQDFQAFEPNNFRSYDRKYALKELIKLTDDLDGDVAECGVYHGGSAFLLSKHLRLTESTRKLYLFDSFEGVSEPDPGVDGSFWKKGWMSVSLEQVQERLRSYQDLVQYFKGWIPHRFQEVEQSDFSFVHIDVDLYQPTQDSLEFFGSRMQSGGILVCDDYGFETCPGARKAMDEFAKKSRTKIVSLPTGQGVIFFK